MADIMIDATVFEDYRRGEPGARAIVEKVLDGSTTASVSPVTIFELWGDTNMNRQAEIGCVSMLSFMEPAPLSPEAAKVAGQWIASLKPTAAEYEHQLLEALWIYQTHNVVQEELLGDLLVAKDHRVRAAATRALSYWLDQVKNPLALLKDRIDDPHPRVRLEAVRALSNLSGDDAIETALGVLEHDVDDYLQYTLDETMRQLER